MFNVFVNDGKSEMPDDDILYIIGQEGVYLKKKLGIIESVTKIKGGIPTLNKVECMAKVNLPKIPASKVATTAKFFKEVYEKHKSESMVLIMYDPETKLYILVPPTQEVSSTSIEYDKSLTIEGYLKVGTIHSHANFSAFHSGVDVADEKHFDGLHITIGHVNSEEVSISASVVANEMRFKVDPLDYMDGLLQTREKSKVTIYPKPSYSVYVWKNGKMVKKEEDKKKNEKPKTEWRMDCRYKLLTPENKIEFNEQWLSLVKKKTYKYGRWGNYQGTNGVWPINNPEDDALFDWYYSRSGKKPGTLNDSPLNVGPASKPKQIPLLPEKNKTPVCTQCIHRDEAFEYTIEKTTQEIDEFDSEFDELDDYSSTLAFTCTDCAHRNDAIRLGLEFLQNEISEEEIEEDIEKSGGRDLYEFDSGFNIFDELNDVKHPDEFTDPDIVIKENAASGDFLNTSNSISDELDFPKIIEDKTIQGNTIRKRFTSGLERFLKRF